MEKKLTIGKVNFLCGISTILIMTVLFMIFFIWQKYAEFRHSEKILKDSQETIISDILTERLATAVVGLNPIVSENQDIAEKTRGINQELMRHIWNGGCVGLIDNSSKKMFFPTMSFLDRLEEQSRNALTSEIMIARIGGYSQNGQSNLPIKNAGTARIRWRAESIAKGKYTVFAIKDMRGIDMVTIGNINRMKIDMLLESAYIIILAIAVCLVAMRFAYSVSKSIDREVSVLTEFCKKGMENETSLSSASFKFQEFEIIAKSLSAMSGQIRSLLLELKNTALKSTITQQLQYGIYSKLSHEIVSKLNDLLGFAQLLRAKLGAETPENTDKIQDIENIIDSGMVISNVLTDISYMPALDTSDFKPSLSLVKMSEIKESVFSQTVSLAKQRNKYIEWKSNSDEDKSIFADKNFIRQILLNMIEIGIYQDSCSVIELESCLSKISDEEVRLQIRILLKDMNIVQTQLDEMSHFPFVSPQLAGMGLRLAICKRLTELLDGSFELAVVSSKDLLATFSACFLIAKSSTEEKTAISTIPGILSFSHLNALVVDDDHGSRDVMASMLSAFGVKSEKAANGLAALEIIEKNPSINIVFLDCQMPVMDGFAFTKEIRRREKESKSPKHLKIIAASGYSTPADIQRCMEMGMDDFISKPFIMGELKLILMKHSF